MLFNLNIVEDNIKKFVKTKHNYYQKEVPYKTRCIESNDILKKYPTYVPIIINTNENILLKKRKFLVPGNLYCSSLIYYIKKQMIKDSDKSVFLFYNNFILDNLLPLSEKYKDYKSKNNNGDDKYFYLELYFENTFG